MQLRAGVQQAEGFVWVHSLAHHHTIPWPTSHTSSDCSPEGISPSHTAKPHWVLDRKGSGRGDAHLWNLPCPRAAQAQGRCWAGAHGEWPHSSSLTSPIMAAHICPQRGLGIASIILWVCSIHTSDTLSKVVSCFVRFFPFSQQCLYSSREHETWSGPRLKLTQLTTNPKKISSQPAPILAICKLYTRTCFLFYSGTEHFITQLNIGVLISTSVGF